MFDNAFDEWKSLYTEELESIWIKERKELRRANMVFYVLRQEFNMIEYGLECELTKFKQKFKMLDNFKEFEKPVDKSSNKFELQPEDCPQSQVIDVLSSNEELLKETHLSRSPKINKNRKFARPKKFLSPSLLDIQKENKNQITSVTSTQKSSDLFGSVVLLRDNLPNNHNILIENMPENKKMLDNENVIDCSIVIDNRPNASVAKKTKRNKSSNSKLTLGKKSPAKQKPSNTLTQMFLTPSKKISKVIVYSKNDDTILYSDDDTFFELNDVNQAKNENRNKNVDSALEKFKVANFKDACRSDGSGSKAETLTTHCIQNRESTFYDDDKTFFETKSGDNQDKNKAQVTNESVPSATKKPKLANFADYDKVPIVKDTGPQHAHKMEAVRRKADRMKLPGWSCTDCQQYYESLNLPVDVLQQKMNACSRHRHKFKLLDETPKGYWDITMASSPDNSGED